MTIQTILEFIAVLAGLIVIHEFGHFVAARIFKVEVEEAGIGYPPRIVTLFEKGGTKYSLNWLPFGGFVRLKGENDPNEPGSFAAAKPWSRIAILLSGPLMNLLTAIVIYTLIITIIGVPDTSKVQIVDVAPNSPAERAGMLPGDLILEINGEEINSGDELHELIYSNLEQPIAITFERDGEAAELVTTPRENPPENEGAVGIVIGNPTNPVSPLTAIPGGFVATYEHSKALLGFAGDLISGNVSSEEGRLLGFKGMYDIYEETRESEAVVGIPPIVNVLMFIVNITISFGILNLLPIPALDGGRIMFVLPEILFRKRVPPKYENVVNLVSFALLLLLLLYINLQDFINPVQIP
jgi:regulator of sigma E protease